MNAKKLFDYAEPLVAAATILAVGALLVSLHMGKVMHDIKTAEDVIEVTGSAKEFVVSDTGRWRVHLETKTGINDEQAGVDRLEAAVRDITAYFEEQGFADYETTITSSYTNYIYPEEQEPVFTGYTLSRDITVRTDDVFRLVEFANNLAPLKGDGYTVTSGSLELTYSELSDMRVKLLSEAIKDAKERANAIAKESGRSVGPLRSASGGVVQVLGEGSVEISDYGSYDTWSMNKDVMVTVRATFGLE